MKKIPHNTHMHTQLHIQKKTQVNRNIKRHKCI